LIVVYSYHHNNTQKLAEAMAKVPNAEIKSSPQTNPEELQEYDLIGLGSGINSGKNYKELLDFADKLPNVTKKKAFIFSTIGMPIGVSGQQRLEAYTCKCHTTLKKPFNPKATRLLTSLDVLDSTLTNSSNILVESTKGDPTAKTLNTLKSSLQN